MICESSDLVQPSFSSKSFCFLPLIVISALIWFGLMLYPNSGKLVDGDDSKLETYICQVESEKLTDKSKKSSNISKAGEIQEMFKRILKAFETDNPAKVARALGIERQSVYPWRDGKVAPSMDRLKQISEITGCSLDWLVRGEEKPESVVAKKSPEEEDRAEYKQSLYYVLWEKRQQTTDPEKRRFIDKLIEVGLKEVG